MRDRRLHRNGDAGLGRGNGATSHRESNSKTVNCRAQTDGLVIVGQDTGSVRCFKSGNLEELWSWRNEAMPAPITQLMIRGDQLIAIDGMTRSFTLEVKTGKLITQNQMGMVRSEISHLRGEILLTGPQNGTPQLWKNGKLVADLAGQKTSFSRVAISSNGRFAFVGSVDASNRIIDIEDRTGGSQLTFLRPDGSPFRYIRSLIDRGDFLYLATDKGVFQTSSTGGNRLISEKIFSTMLERKSDLLGVDGAGQITLMNTEGTVLSTLHPPKSMKGAARYFLASAGDDHFLAAEGKGWALFGPDRGFQEFIPFPENIATQPMTSFRANLNKSEVLAAGFGGIINWTRDKGVFGKPVPLNNAGMVESVKGWTGDFVLWRDPEMTLKLGNFETGKIEILAREVSSASIDQVDGQSVIAIGFANGEVSIQKLSGEALAFFQHPASAKQPSPGGRLVLRQNASQPGSGMAFSLDHRFLATSRGFHIFLWDWRSGNLVWKSDQIPAGLFGGLQVKQFLTSDRLLCLEGSQIERTGAPAGYIQRIATEVPDSKTVREFGGKVLKLEIKDGLLRRVNGAK